MRLFKFTHFRHAVSNFLCILAKIYPDYIARLPTCSGSKPTDMLRRKVETLPGKKVRTKRHPAGSRAACRDQQKTVVVLEIYNSLIQYQPWMLKSLRTGKRFFPKSSKNPISENSPTSYGKNTLPAGYSPEEATFFVPSTNARSTNSKW